MTIEIVGIFPLIAWWIFPVRYVNVYQRVIPSFQCPKVLLSLALSSIITSITSIITTSIITTTTAAAERPE